MEVIIMVHPDDDVVDDLLYAAAGKKGEREWRRMNER
jgi:hypothetical protein